MSITCYKQQRAVHHCWSGSECSVATMLTCMCIHGSKEVEWKEGSRKKRALLIILTTWFIPGVGADCPVTHAKTHQVHDRQVLGDSRPRDVSCSYIKLSLLVEGNTSHVI